MIKEAVSPTTRPLLITKIIMTKITLSSFTRETLEENIKPYRQQIQNGSVKLIQSEKTADLIHADTFDQMETYLQSYFGFIWLGFQMQLPPDKLQESITAYVESWDKAKKQDAMTNEFNITGDLQGWISLFVREIYLQPIYCYEARKEYPDTLPYETLIFQRFLYLRDKTTFFPQKYSELSQKEYRKYRKLLSAGNKEAIRDVKNILLFTENLLSEIPAYLYGSPILTAFIKAMLDFKKTYDFIFPNEGLPLMDKYFDNIYIQRFTVDFFPFEKDLTPNFEKKPTFKTELSVTQLEEIYQSLIIKEYIDKNTGFNLFKAVFSGKDYASNEKIKWILLNRTITPHKTALRELLELVIIGKPTQKIIDNWFSDVKGNPIKLSKPKKNEASNYYLEFENLIKK